MTLKSFVRRTPIVGPPLVKIWQSLFRKEFRNSDVYWEQRYRSGGNSGVGSYGEFAAFKAEIINAFVMQNNVQTVVEFGCGDGNQLQYMHYPRYLGIDVSPAAIECCRRLYGKDPSKQFSVTRSDGSYGAFDLALSLDVIFHLVEDHVFDAYMHALFGASTRFVIIYASNGDPSNGTHAWGPAVRHRRFTEWVEKDQARWKLHSTIPNRYPYRVENNIEYGSFADFYIYERSATFSTDSVQSDG